MGLIPNVGDRYEVASKYADLPTALSAIGGTAPVTLHIDQDIECASTVTVPGNVTLKFTRGAKIKMTAVGGTFLIIYGDIEAGRYQIFDLNNFANETRVSEGGPPYRGKVADVFPEWWGENTDPGQTNMYLPLRWAIRSMKSGGRLLLAPETYRTNSTLPEPLTGITIQGVAGQSNVNQALGQGSIIVWGGAVGTGTGPIMDTNATTGTVIRDVEFNCVHPDDLGHGGKALQFNGSSNNFRLDNVMVIGYSERGISLGEPGSSAGTLQHMTWTNIRMSAVDGGVASIYINSNASENNLIVGLHVGVPTIWAQSPRLGTPHVILDAGSLTIIDFNTSGGSPERDIISDPGDIYVEDDYAVQCNGGLGIYTWSSEDNLPGPNFKTSAGGKPCVLHACELRSPTAGHANHPPIINWGAASEDATLHLAAIQIGKGAGGTPITPGGDINFGGTGLVIADGIVFTEGTYGSITVIGANANAQIRNVDGMRLQRNDVPSSLELYKPGGDLAFTAQGQDLKLYENRSNPEVAVRVSGLSTGGLLDLKAILADPTAVDAGRGQLYVKDVSGIAELFFVDEDENVTQITSAGSINADEITGVSLQDAYNSGNAISGDDPVTIAGSQGTAVETTGRIVADADGAVALQTDGGITVSGTNPHILWAADATGNIGSASVRPASIYSDYVESDFFFTGPSTAAAMSRRDRSIGLGVNCLFEAVDSSNELVVLHKNKSVTQETTNVIVAVWDAGTNNPVDGKLFSTGWANASDVFQEQMYVTVSGHLRWGTDGASDIGKVNDFRPKDIFATGSINLNSGNLFIGSEDRDTGLGVTTNITNGANAQELILIQELQQNIEGRIAIASVWNADVSTPEAVKVHSFGFTDDADTYKEMGYVDALGNLQASGIITAAGQLTVGSGIQTDTGDIEVVQSGNGIILSSPDGTRYRVQVEDGGSLTTTAI